MNIKPNYYNKGDIECFDAIKAATSNLTGLEAFATGNAIKYLWRFKEKNGREDLLKAKEYLDLLLKLNTPQVDNNPIH